MKKRYDFPVQYMGEQDKEIITITETKETYDNIGISIELSKKGTYLLGIHEIDLESYYMMNVPTTKIDIAGNGILPKIQDSYEINDYYLIPNISFIGISYEFEIEKNGNVKKATKQNKIIQLGKHLTYEEVNSILNDKPISKEIEKYQKPLKLLKEVSLAYSKNYQKKNYGQEYNEIIERIIEDYHSNAKNLLSLVYDIPFSVEEEKPITTLPNIYCLSSELESHTNIRKLS